MSKREKRRKEKQEEEPGEASGSGEAPPIPPAPRAPRRELDICALANARALRNQEAHNAMMRRSHQKRQAKGKRVSYKRRPSTTEATSSCGRRAPIKAIRLGFNTPYFDEEEYGITSATLAFPRPSAPNPNQTNMFSFEDRPVASASCLEIIKDLEDLENDAEEEEATAARTTEIAQSSQPVQSMEPLEPLVQLQQFEHLQQSEPMEPIEAKESTEAKEPTEANEQSGTKDQPEPTAPAELTASAEPMEPKEPEEKTEPTESTEPLPADAERVQEPAQVAADATGASSSDVPDADQNQK